MSESIEESYFNWLCAKVLRQTNNVYRDLLRLLHSVEFVWTIVGDQNRAEDGKELRDHFLNQIRLEKGGLWLWYDQPCSIFEMLLAFSDRASFQTDDPLRDWFWELIENLQLGEMRQVSDDNIDYIQDVIETFLWRTYSENGVGGLFPLSRPKYDQREVEIWYQFCEYVDEQGRI